MHQNADNLLDLLQSQIGHYQKLSELLEQEQKNLIELNLDKLQKISKVKEDTVQDIKLLIEPLAGEIKTLAQKLGLETNPLPTLTQLTEYLSGPLSGRLRKSAQDLAAIKTDVFKHNQDNQHFIQETLGLIEGSLGILTGANLGKAKQYLPNGQQAATESSRPVKLSREI